MSDSGERQTLVHIRLWWTSDPGAHQTLVDVRPWCTSDSGHVCVCVVCEELLPHTNSTNLDLDRVCDSEEKRQLWKKHGHYREQPDDLGSEQNCLDTPVSLTHLGLTFDQSNE
ncbi:hypothetical protein WMY93_000933 [Mugilogobius chulae]|uniref:Uncharacterized protein n=1 Tax=Mugilogobius chulae TaxID=88201 RepID=A0AAW0QBG5_9GOBI